MPMVKDTGRKALIVFEKLKKKEGKFNKPAPASTASIDASPEILGTPEMMDITKKDYGFDWEKSKGIDVDEYCPEG